MDKEVRKILTSEDCIIDDITLAKDNVIIITALNTLRYDIIFDKLSNDSGYKVESVEYYGKKRIKIDLNNRKQA